MIYVCDYAKVTYIHHSRTNKTVGDDRESAEECKKELNYITNNQRKDQAIF